MKNIKGLYGWIAAVIFVVVVIWVGGSRMLNREFTNALMILLAATVVIRILMVAHERQANISDGNEVPEVDD